MIPASAAPKIHQNLSIDQFTVSSSAPIWASSGYPPASVIACLTSASISATPSFWTNRWGEENGNGIRWHRRSKDLNSFTHVIWRVRHDVGSVLWRHGVLWIGSHSNRKGNVITSRKLKHPPLKSDVGLVCVRLCLRFAHRHEDGVSGLGAATTEEHGKQVESKRVKDSRDPTQHTRAVSMLHATVLAAFDGNTNRRTRLLVSAETTAR